MNIEECKFYDKETGCIECKQVFVQDLYKGIKQLKEENEELKEKCSKYQNEICPQYSEELQQAYVRANKAELKLEKIEELCKDLMSENEEYASITQILKIIRGEE